MKNIFLLFLLMGGLMTPTLAQLNEGFEGNFPPAGWLTFNNGIGTNQDWKQSTTNPNTGNAHAFVRLENVSSGIAEDWLVTPQLFPTAGDNTLTFYAADDFPTEYTSFYTVRISTTSQSDVGSFNTIATYFESDFTNDVYQQFTVDLSAYNEQNIYVAFVMENDDGDSFLLDDVSGPALVTPATIPNCDATLTTPNHQAIKIPINTKLTWQAATGEPTGYKLKIGTTTGGDEFLTLTDVGAATTYDPASNFAYGTTYYVTILPYNGAGDADNKSCSEFNFSTIADPSFVVDCAGTGESVSRTLCYGDDEVTAFTISSNNSDQVKLVFNSGTVEDGADQLYIYDGTDDTGTLLNEGQLYGNAGDLTGLSYVSTSGNLYFRLESDVNNSCNNGVQPQTQIEYTASCASCTPPAATVEVASCSSFNNTFAIEVDITDLGSGDVIITNDQNSDTENINATGMVTVGPFDFGTVTLSLQNTSNGDCDITLEPITVAGCLPANDDCVDAVTLTLSTDDNCNNSVAGTTNFATPFVNDGNCAGANVDVWYKFTPTSADTYIFQTSGLDVGAFASIALYTGDCNGILTPVGIDCANEGTLSLDLTANQEYLVQISANNNEQTSDFDLCVIASPAAPANDLCNNAILISNDIENNLVDQDATYATNTDAVSCSENPISRGIWYRVVGNGDLLNFTVNPVEWDAEIQVWSGADCQSLTCMLNKDAGTTGATESVENFVTEDGMNYYIYVGAYSDNQPTGGFSANSEFTVALAVDLLSFDGAATGKTNTLNWASANEVNLENYIIERSENGQSNWEKMGEVTARNQSAQRYEWIDKTPLSFAYYRLRAVDFSGEYKLSDIIHIKQEQSNVLSIVPVPAKDWVMVEYYAPLAGQTELILTDVTGRIVQKQEVRADLGINNIDVELSELNTGIYILTIINADNQSVVRVVKQ